MSAACFRCARDVLEMQPKSDILEVYSSYILGGPHSTYTRDVLEMYLPCTGDTLRCARDVLEMYSSYSQRASPTGGGGGGAGGAAPPDATLICAPSARPAATHPMKGAAATYAAPVSSLRLVRAARALEHSHIGKSSLIGKPSLIGKLPLLATSSRHWEVVS